MDSVDTHGDFLNRTKSVTYIYEWIRNLISDKKAKKSNDPVVRYKSLLQRVQGTYGHIYL